MKINPKTGHEYIFTGFPPNENEFNAPNPSLTAAVVVFCIAGPF